MKLARVGVIAAAVLAVATLAWAQKTDFSGTWTLDPEASGAAPGGAPGGGGGGGGRGGGRGGMGGGIGFACANECTIAQDATTLTVTRTGPQGELKSVFKLDGTESTNSMAMGENKMDFKSKAVWEGSKLVITTTGDMGGNPFESKATLSLDASGNLVVERSGGRGAQPTQTYKKG